MVAIPLVARVDSARGPHPMSRHHDDASAARTLGAARVRVVDSAVPHESPRARFARDVREGLARVPKSIPSFYFYDARGSELFRRITALPEYYLTRVERSILEAHGERIVSPFRGMACDVIDLGAGDGVKSRILLDALRHAGADPRYLPVDVSATAVESALEGCGREGAWLDAEGVVAEYGDAVRWLAGRADHGRRLVLWLGSNVGNLDWAASLRFFRELRGALHPGDHVLIGFDLVKDPELLKRAYDDAAGVTREFNLNLLRRINRELEADFRLEAFRHVATYSPALRRMESCLVSLEHQTVTVDGTRFELHAWEPIHTEISCKYRARDVRALAVESGFRVEDLFHDERGAFVDALWRVPGDEARGAA